MFATEVSGPVEWTVASSGGRQVTVKGSIAVCGCVVSAVEMLSR